MSEKFLVADGIFSEGYGFIPKKLMRDKGLSVEAKAIYAYLSSFAGAGMSSYPSVSLMLKELGISKDRFYKHRKMLIDLGYISIKQVKSKDKTFSNNVYVINTLPLPCFKDTEKPDTEKPDTEDKDTNSNSSNSNSLNSNSDKEMEAKASLSSGDDAPEKASVKDQIEMIIDEWNRSAPHQVKAVTRGSTRDAQLRARLKQFSVDDFIEAIRTIPFSPFLLGQNNRGWVIKFDWFIKPSNFQKVLEGNYVGEKRGAQNYATNSNGNTPHNIRVQQELQRRAKQARESGVLDNFDGPL